MEKMDFLSLLSSFGVPISIHLKAEEEGNWISGEWVKSDNESILEVEEPFIPSSLATQLPFSTNYGEGGYFEKYEMIWFSSQKVPLKTIVTHNNLNYSVEHAIDYKDYSNVTQYGCRAVEQFGNRKI
ncbi:MULTISPECIES: hypothetical protein [Carnobacterium]|jgi:hypothetical protein|uniref:hypothetical protein n=1 Tax=Carnobacterium TaxID=2747 RepID=UPI00165CB809|nr:hypothetical protein [Carnobacterium maltaromaticum]MBC9789539.1 hypothetical protein [Carnobacterium maltaromaticum]MCI1842368.1 hypothetical protein [Lactococcus lactis]